MKILCLGTNTEDTDILTRLLSGNDLCHGLLSEFDTPLLNTQYANNGWYHSSVYDIELGRLKDIASEFDQVIMLDQPKEQYTHPNAFYKTVSLIKNLPNGKFINPAFATDIDFFEKLVQTNKSFCIFPFIELLTNQRSDGQTTVCCRSSTPITHVDKIINWQTNEDYNRIRDKMILGESLPTHCSDCYRLEDRNIISPRQQETVEWANRLNLATLEDLYNITYPAYYEIRPSNICNLQCRMCDPQSSHLIGQEYRRINLIPETRVATKYIDFKVVNFSNLKKLYVAGGEPTAMPEFYNFVDECIKNKKTDFEFVISTNASKLNARFKKQMKHFSNMQFTVSIDGLGPLNHYIRWPSDWQTIIENTHYLQEHGHTVTTNTVVSIYNVTRLYELLEFFDQEFPGILGHTQLASGHNDILSPFNFPNIKLALDKLLPIQQLTCYNNDAVLKSFIDGLIEHYQSNPTVDQNKLKLFFEFNDKLDKSRNIQLRDYIAELEQSRL